MTPAVAPPVAPVAAPMVAPAAATIPSTQQLTNPTALSAATGTLVTIREIDRVNTTLGNDVSASYARLQQITQMVLERSGGGGAQLIVEHHNEMSSTFRLVRATYSLDGATVATRVDENGSLADQQNFAVYNGRVASGEHTLTVNLEYQGNGYGIFSYLRGYTFRARSVQNVQVPEGRALRLTVQGYERGGATTAIEERPAIRYNQQVMTLPEAQALVSRANAPTTGGTSAGTAGAAATTP
ncbi:MAG: hypothetical protein JNK72_04165 [Myxococcales bacterium]|nr:hypothetical protein [Myxococcales bacterium]